MRWKIIYGIGITKNETNKEERRIVNDVTTEPNQAELDKSDIGCKVFNELNMEEFGKIGEITTPSGHTPIDLYQQELGLHMNQEGLSSPVYGKLKGKRGRKSLKEL